MSDHAMASPTSDAAYADFVRTVWNHHLRVARLLTGDPERGEELLQECLVKLYVRWRKVAKRGDPQAYLRRMLVNGSVSRWRSGRREHLLAEPPERADPVADGALAAVHEPREELRRALLALPRQQRAVVVLRHYADLTEREVAATLGCTIGTVKSHHARAMARMRELLPDPNHQTQKV